MTDTDTHQSDLEPIGTTSEALHKQAFVRIQKRREFQGHLTAYLAVNLTIWAIWGVIGTVSDAWFPWPLFVTLGWGIGVVMNAWEVYLRTPITEDEVRREMDRLASAS